jgi:predicted alpha/beta hydrolase family esterase
MTLAFESPTELPVPIVVTAKGDSAAPALPARIELDLSKFHNGRWALHLDAVFARHEAPVVILAHGIACRAVAWWAQLSPRSYLRAISGALFHTPLHVGFDQIAAAAAMQNGPACCLPFPSIVISDPSFQVEQALALADAWGSRFVATDSAAPGQASNRNARFTAIETMLLGHRDRFEINRAAAMQPSGPCPIAMQLSPSDHTTIKSD